MLSGIPRTFRNGETVFTQGDAAADMYFIKRGNVRIVHSADDGDMRELAFMEPGDFFGEIALFHSGPRTASAIAVGDIELEAVDRPTLMNALESDPELKHIIAEMSARIRELQGELAE